MCGIFIKIMITFKLIALRWFHRMMLLIHRMMLRFVAVHTMTHWSASSLCKSGIRWTNVTLVRTWEYKIIYSYVIIKNDVKKDEEKMIESMRKFPSLWQVPAKIYKEVTTVTRTSLKIIFAFRLRGAVAFSIFYLNTRVWNFKIVTATSFLLFY